LDPETLKKNMLDYPIYKHLKQFSTLVDAMGNLTIQSPTINELEE